MLEVASPPAHLPPSSSPRAALTRQAASAPSSATTKQITSSPWPYFQAVAILVATMATFYKLAHYG